MVFHRRKSEKTDADHTSEPRFNNWWLPVLIGVLLMMLVGLLWWVLDRQVEDEQNRVLDAEAQKLISYIDSDFRARIPALQRIVTRWETRGGTPREEFVSDTLAYIADIPGFQALEWVDRSFYIRWVVPFRGNEQAVNLNLAYEKRRREALEQAMIRRSPIMSSPIDLVQGGKGFLILFPIYVEDEFDGFLMAVFRIQDWLDYIFSLNEHQRDEEDIRAAVFIGDERVYTQPGWEPSPGNRPAYAVFLNKSFRISVKPADPFLRSRSPLPGIAAVSGFILSLIVVFMVFLYQQAATAAWRTHAAKTAMVHEIEERKKTEEKLKQISDRLALATRAGGIGVWTWDLGSNKLEWDDRMFAIYGLPPDITTIFDVWSQLVHPEDLTGAEQLLQDALAGKAVFDTELRINRPDGAERIIRAAATVVRDESGEPMNMTGVNWDITEQKQAEDQIRHMANHDALTGLPSLRLAYDRISLAVGTARRNETQAAVMFVDLDGFKQVNDTYGHDAGDLLLKEVALRLTACVRETDTVARIGGDEFLVILSELKSRKNSVIVAEKVMDRVSRPISVSGIHVTVGSSIGIALFPADGEEPKQLVKQADEAMYIVKKGGKNGYAFVGDSVKNPAS